MIITAINSIPKKIVAPSILTSLFSISEEVAYHTQDRKDNYPYKKRNPFDLAFDKLAENQCGCTQIGKVHQFIGKKGPMILHDGII